MKVLCAAVLISVFSMVMMGYLAMTTDLGPWIAPIFTVVVMIFMRSLFKEEKISKNMIAVITSSSLSGMIGMCLGLSLPSFFFIKQKTFKVLLKNPWEFSVVVGLFVIAASLYAFLLGYILHHYFLVESNRKFPMSRLVYDVLYNEKPSRVRFFTLVGVVVSFVINQMIKLSSFLSFGKLVHFNMYPLLASIGFITGERVAVPALIGLVTRVITFRLIHIYIPSQMTDRSLVITFCIGMILAWFLLNMNTLFLKKTDGYWKTHNFLLRTFKQRWFLLWLLVVVIVNALLLSYWELSVFFVLPILMMLMLLALYSIDILSVLGVVDIATYILFVIFGMIYFIPTSFMTMIAVSVMATLCLGIVVDLMFSYKLAALARVDYKFVTKYQLIGVATSVICSGIFFWLMSSVFSLQPYSELAHKTYQIEEIFKFSEYNPHILLLGVMYGFILKYLRGDLLAIVGGVLIQPEVSAILVVSGAFANMIKNREKIYPVFLGIYAGHMLWLLLGIFK